MKRLVTLVVLVVAVAAKPYPQEQQQSYQPYQDAQILRYDAENDGLGTYRFAYEQSDGQRREEQGELKNAGTDEESIAVRGSYGWVGPDGVTYQVNYIADENGFQPTIEQGPGGGVPPAVVASLLG